MIKWYISSVTGNRTLVSRVTGGDTSHYTMTDLIITYFIYHNHNIYIITTTFNLKFMQLHISIYIILQILFTSSTYTYMYIHKYWVYSYTIAKSLGLQQYIQPLQIIYTSVLQINMFQLLLCLCVLYGTFLVFPPLLIQLYMQSTLYMSFSW